MSGQSFHKLGDRSYSSDRDSSVSPFQAGTAPPPSLKTTNPDRSPLHLLLPAGTSPPPSGSLDHGGRTQGRRWTQVHRAPVPGRRLAGGPQDILGGPAGPVFASLPPGPAVARRYLPPPTLAWAALPVAAPLALLYLACRMFYTNYLRETLVADMADIDGTYMRRPGAGFWVVEDQVGGSGLRGVVAAQEFEGSRAAASSSASLSTGDAGVGAWAAD
ncbi:uncharacterized protein LOC129693502 isoform X2 [Leucoraja erinacea]|uniref:uncharacterized protein LOC129693502 isoform X2 n=1 Tax=Leucoraja erinaceus TaxID=7782 RepID=UPI002457EF34|nr:uncharacterized protein LOC129693502 isoform X2 [Leucoraja erinacea]